MSPQLQSTGGLVVDGILAAEAIDSSGELLKVKGCDISSMESDGILNFEHLGNEAGPSAIIGKCIKCRKIYKPEDCENERQLEYYDRLKVPIIYAAFRLLDNQDHVQAKAAAAFIRDQVENKEEITYRYSIEGSTLSMKDKVIEQSIARSAALTSKPCNKASVSGILHDPKNPSKEESEDPLASFGKFENPAYSIIASGSAPGIMTPVDEESCFLDGCGQFLSLVKALTAGSGSVAPSALVSGAALQKEHLLGDDRKRIVDVCKAAIESHDPEKHGPFKKYLKSMLPEASDEFLEHFEDLADDIKISKKLHKAEKAPTKRLMYQGSVVEPGETEVTDPGFDGKSPSVYKYSLVNIGSTHHVVHDPNFGMRRVPAKNSRILRPPKVVKAKTQVDARVHGHPLLHSTQEQHDILHGVDFAKRTSVPVKSSTLHGDDTAGEVGWYKSNEGHSVYVKPSFEYESDEWTPQHSETAYKQMADNFWGLGEHVPVTTTFRHPITGRWASAQKQVQGEHLKQVGTGNPELGQLARTGQLDKIAMMDMVSNNFDRHFGNALMSPEGHLHLIDNEMAYDSGEGGIAPDMGQVWPDGHFYNDGPQWHQKPMHPEAVEWLKTLEPAKMKKEMVKLGIPQKARTEAVRRLAAVKALLLKNPNASKADIYNAPFTGVAKKIFY